MATPTHDRTDDVRRLVAEHMPGYDTRSVRPLGGGLDNTAYEVGGELIVRFREEPDAARRAEGVTAEARLLDELAGLVTVAVPRPVFDAPDDGCVAYSKVHGMPLIGVAEPSRSRIGAAIAPALGDLLTAMHRAPVDGMAELVAVDDEPLAAWQREAAELYAQVRDQLPEPRRPAVEAFLAAAPPPDSSAAVFSHNDLGIEHLLVDPEAAALTGVIDWSDAAIVDPAADFGRLLRDLGVRTFDAILRRYRAGGDDRGALRARAAFYARCMMLEDLAYGIETKLTAYSEKSLAAAEWLFPR